MKCLKCKKWTEDIFVERTSLFRRMYGNTKDYLEIPSFCYCAECDKIFKKLNLPKLKELK